MSTKNEWIQHIKERKAFAKAYAKETIKMEKWVKKLPPGDVIVAYDAPIETPPKPPVNP